MASCVVAAVLLSACGGIETGSSNEPAAGGAASGVAVPNSPEITVSVPAEVQTTTTRSPAPRLDEVDLVTYVATIESLLEGTEYAGRALAAPDVFLATGGLFCDQLDDGKSSDEVLIKYLETLTGGAVDEASEDDLAMAGAVLGTGLVTMCPHHLAAFGGSE